MLAIQEEFFASLALFTLTAVLIISSDGIITGSSPLAATWWNLSDGATLEGRAFCELFRMEVVAETEEDKAFQWQLLRDSAGSQPLNLEIENEEEETVSVTVILEEVRMAGASGAIVACVSRTETSSAAVSESLRPAAAEAVPPRPTATGLTELLAEAEHIGLFRLNLAENSFHYSAAWMRMLGYEPDELPDTHETFIKLVHPEDSEATPDHPPEGQADSRSNFSVEFRMRHKMGAYVWIQSIGVQEYGPSGGLTRVTGFHLDIQERKELEEESLQHEERFLTLIQRGQIGFFDLDFRNRTAFFSPAWQRILGYDNSDLENMPDTFRSLVDDQMAGAEDLVSLFTDSRSGRSCFARELRMQRKDGGYINLHTHIVRLTDRRGELTRVLGFQIGIDDAPPETWSGPSPQALFACLQEVNEAVVLTDADSNVIFFNRKAVALTGFEESEVVGRPLPESLRLVRSYDHQAAENLSDQVLVTGNPILFSRDFLLAQAETEPRKIVLSCTPLRDSREKILGGVLVFRDPVEMSLTPEELVRSNRMESLGLLAGGVAHDFNNLLTSIVGGISLARDTREWPPLDTSEKACLSAKNLTRQLLTFARGRESARKPQHIGNLIQDCVRLASSGSKVKPKIELPDTLFPVSIDPARVSQVFQNLIINAIQGMGDAGGSLIIAGENVAVGQGEIAGLGPGDFLRVSVKDTGRGIPPENLIRIFHPFFTTKKSGTGLGLSTVASIVRDHEGQITVASKEGVGTTFFVYLPKSDKPVEAEARRVPTLKFGTGRILFMDDDEEIAALAGAMLERLDYEFDLARNGEEALVLYRRYLKLDRPYDAVILDLTIVGGMGGEETFKALRELNPEVRAIVSSGYSTEDSHEHYLKQGFYGVLAKPYRSEEMGKLLRHVLGYDQRPENGAAASATPDAVGEHPR